MGARQLDHVEIAATDVEAAARFYAEVLGLEARDPPAPLTRAQTIWMYDAEGRAIVHLRAGGEGDNTAGPVNHLALRCSDKAKVVERLARFGGEYRVLDTGSPAFDLVFARDPSGVMLELNFSEV